MDDCVLILSEKSETELDVLLATQAKCHVIMGQMTQSSVEWAADGAYPTVPPVYFVKAMPMQVQNIRQSLPAEMQSNSQRKVNSRVTEQKLTPNRFNAAVHIRHGNHY
jgi:hypothetical protein